jgi:hypothetical protein
MSPDCAETPDGGQLHFDIRHVPYDPLDRVALEGTATELCLRTPPIALSPAGDRLAQRDLDDHL